jgi:hypothetical protein
MHVTHWKIYPIRFIWAKKNNLGVYMYDVGGISGGRYKLTAPCQYPLKFVWPCHYEGKPLANHCSLPNPRKPLPLVQTILQPVQVNFVPYWALPLVLERKTVSYRRMERSSIIKRISALCIKVPICLHKQDCVNFGSLKMLISTQKCHHP